MAGRRLLFVVGLVLFGAGLTACSEDNPNDFEAGSCTNDDFSAVVTEIEIVDCEEEHTAEAIAQFDLGGDDYPGAEEIAAEAQEECLGDTFEDYVGIPYEESVYTMDYLPPTEQSWDNGDRTVICYISGTTDGSDLDGSAEGSEI